MNKKLSIFAIVLIIVGLIGSIWSGIFSMPYFVNKIQTYDTQINKENTIYDKKLNIDKLNINTSHGNVQILKSDSENFVIKTKGLENYSQIEINNQDNVLSIEEKFKDTSTEKIKSLDDLLNIVMEETFSNHRNMIMIYVPKNVDLDITTDNAMLDIEDDIFLNSFNFKTNSGGIALPNEIKSLKKMNIYSQNNISLQLYELFGIEEVNVNCNSVEIYGDNYNLNDIEKYIPKKMTINTDNLNEGIINITSSSPISEELIINGYKSDVYLNLPMAKYKLNFDLKAYDSIELNDFLSDMINNNKYNTSDNDEDSNNIDEIKELKRTINDDEKVEYKINILASDIHFE